MQRRTGLTWFVFGFSDKRGVRYFDPGGNNWETCFNCGEEGHIAANCTMEKRQKPCFYCGLFGHNSKQCLQVSYHTVLYSSEVNVNLHCLLPFFSLDCQIISVEIDWRWWLLVTCSLMVYINNSRQNFCE